MNAQTTASRAFDELAEAKTKKAEFLALMDSVIPWGQWAAMVKPCYYKGARGNKPYPIGLMLRLHILQNLYNLSDMATAAAVIDSRAFSRFCGVSSLREMPDGDTIGRFRNLLIAHGLQEKLFRQVVESLAARRLILKRGTIVDSTIISAPSSTKNREHSRDPEAHSVKKGNQWHFGFKAGIGVDADTGLAHSLATTAANQHDVTMTAQLLCGEETDVYGDSGFLSAEKRPEAKLKNSQGKKICYHINRRPSQTKGKNNHSQGQIRRYEHKKSSVRAKVEHVFGVVKQLFKFRKTRLRGLAKQRAQQCMVFALANLYLARRRYWFMR